MCKKTIYLLFATLLLLASSCDEDKVQDLNKDGAIETVMNVEHFSDKLDVVKTTHKIWVKNVLVKTCIHTDTIPSLGISKEQAENNNGETKDIVLKKDYEFYITVK